MRRADHPVAGVGAVAVLVVLTWGWSAASAADELPWSTAEGDSFGPLEVRATVAPTPGVERSAHVRVEAHNPAAETTTDIVLCLSVPVVGTDVPVATVELERTETAEGCSLSCTAGPERRAPASIQLGCHRTTMAPGERPVLVADVFETSVEIERDALTTVDVLVLRAAGCTLEPTCGELLSVGAVDVHWFRDSTDIVRASVMRRGTTMAAVSTDGQTSASIETSLSTARMLAHAPRGDLQGATSFVQLWRGLVGTLLLVDEAGQETVLERETSLLGDCDDTESSQPVGGFWQENQVEMGPTAKFRARLEPDSDDPCAAELFASFEGYVGRVHAYVKARSPNIFGGGFYSAYTWSVNIVADRTAPDLESTRIELVQDEGTDACALQVDVLASDVTTRVAAASVVLRDTQGQTRTLALPFADPTQPQIGDAMGFALVLDEAAALEHGLTLSALADARVIVVDEVGHETTHDPIALDPTEQCPALVADDELDADTMDTPATDIERDDTTATGGDSTPNAGDTTEADAPDGPEVVRHDPGCGCRTTRSNPERHAPLLLLAALALGLVACKRR